MEIKATDLELTKAAYHNLAASHFYRTGNLRLTFDRLCAFCDLTGYNNRYNSYESFRSEFYRRLKKQSRIISPKTSTT